MSAASPVVLILAWELVTRLGYVDTRFFPAPSEILQTAQRLLTDGTLARQVGISVQRVVIGFVIGAVPAILIGLIMGLVPIVRAALRPLVNSTYPIPKSALLPLFLLLFGLGEESKWAIIAVGTFYLVLINTMTGVLNIDPIYFDVAKSVGASSFLKLSVIAFPGSLPLIFAGLKLGMGVSLIVLVYAESVGTTGGIGYLIWNSWEVFQVPRMYLGIMTTAVLGLLAASALESLERLLVPWKQR
ncbi:MAG: ABC transporter permease [Planctomycetes bacterium]|nr:ABC transporter permease [Planctomycetota bacterium]